MSPILTSIIKDTYTISSLNRRVRALKHFLSQSLFKKGEVSPDELFIEDEDIKWLENFDQKLLSTFNANNFYAEFQKIEEEVKKVTPLIIYLPIEFPDAEVIKLGQKVRSLFSPNLIIDIKYDPTLIAGCNLVYNGSSKDYSLKKAITDNQKRIIEEFGKIGKA